MLSPPSPTDHLRPVLFTLLVGLFAACHAHHGSPQVMPITPGVQGDGSVIVAVDWFSAGLEAAIALARREHKRVYLDVGAYWCPPCHRMEEEVYTDKSVAQTLERGFIALHVDIEKEDGNAIAERYQVQAYPTLLVLDASGVEMGRLVDFTPANVLKRGVEHIAAGQNHLASLQADVARNPDDLEKSYQLASAYALSANKASAERQMDGILHADPDNARGYAERVLYDHAFFITAKLDHDLERAIVEMQTLQTRFPGTDKAARAYRMMGRFHAELGRPDEAVACLQKLVALDPDNVDWYANFGWFSFRQRVAPNVALEALQTGLAKFPANAELHYLAGELNRALGHKTKAADELERAAALEPKTNYYRRRARELRVAANAP
jgi:thioredoxin-like negative regulator of GroEL